MRPVARLGGLALGLLLGATGCKGGSDEPEAPPHYTVPGVGLEIPNLPGWVQDTSLGRVDAARGGTVFRLVRASSTTGSPRITVDVDASGEPPTTLDAFLTRNLRQMAELEQAGEIHISFVDQRPVQVGPRKAYRVRHEYSVGKGPDQMAITQIATLLVIDGRGVSISAAGRTELFHPLAASVERVLSGVTTSVAAASAPRRSVTPSKGTPSMVEPIDLGKLGGKD